jgi:hypothetical protein
VIPLLLGCADLVPPPGRARRVDEPTEETGALPAAAPIEEALSDRCPDPAPKVTAPTGGDLHRATLLDPSAVCNDGTPAVLWMRRGAPEHARDWVVHLDGGRHCHTWESCAARWCGEGELDASKMSSRWAPETLLGGGVSGAAPENPFRGWNQVVLHYCSSDRWAGTRHDVVLDGDPPFRLHFAGADILEAALHALGAGLASDDGAVALPPLADAERILFSGSSAGGKGVAVHLDRVAAALPQAEVFGLVDAVFAPDRTLLEPELAAALRDHLRAGEAERDAVWGQVHDASCEAAGPSWACGDTAVLLGEHVATPFLQHHDLYDAEIFALELAPFGARRSDYLSAAVGTFERREADGGADGFLLTACGVHAWLSRDLRFLAFETVDADGGPPLTLAEGARRLVSGASLHVVPEAVRATCP